MRKMNKRGQFYLVAAILIVLTISGIASIKTYAAIKSEPRKIQDISAELNEEGMRIVDYGIYNTGQDLITLLNEFDEEFAPYFLKKTEQTNIVFLYGNETDLYSVQYKEEDTGTVYATLGGGMMEWLPPGTYANRTKITPIGDIITVNVVGQEFEFDLQENEMFYFIITQEKEGETYVERN